MSSPRSIAAAQTIPIRCHVEANLAQHLRLVRTAAELGAQVLVFPELSLTGYELDLADALAFSERDPRLAPLIESASAHRMILVVGAPVRQGAGLHIGAFILPPDGSVGLYTKHHLGAFPESAAPDGVVPPAEATVFEPGRLNPLVRFGENVAAVAICADISRPSHAEHAAGRGANTYLAGMFSIPSDFGNDTSILGSYASRHSMAVVLANYGGPSGGLPGAGGSTIWSETGEVLARLGETGSGVVVAAEGDGGWRAGTVMLDPD